ncbi:MAG: leucyl aminopeptidase, partial [Lachnospiraceae bacterium]|nr:leucyl aminopeptidase [Lachnospiraceae bacterium]
MSERIELSIGRIAEIPAETLVPQPFRDYFDRVAEFLLSVKKGADNRKLYEDILPDHYSLSYANPDYAVTKLGPLFGPILSAIYAELRGVIPCVFEGDETGTATFY